MEQETEEMGGANETFPEEVVELIQNTYVLFLKKLITHLEKKNESQTMTFQKLQYVYKTFLEADAKEKFDVYNACKDMLERWYKRYNDMKAQVHKTRRYNDAAVVSEDSQSDASSSSKVESKGQPATKTATTTSSSVPSGLSIASVVSCSKPSTPTTVSQESFTGSYNDMHFHDEIEIEFSDSSTSYSALPENKTEKWNPAINIKKEEDSISANPQVTTPYNQDKESATVLAAPPQNIPQETTMKPAATDQQEEMTFLCAVVMEKDPLSATPQVTTPYNQDKESATVLAAAPQNIPQETTMKPAATDQQEEMTFLCAVVMEKDPLPVTPQVTTPYNQVKASTAVLTAAPQNIPQETTMKPAATDQQEEMTFLCAVEMEKDPLPATPQVTTPYNQDKESATVLAAASQNIPQATAVQPAATDQINEIIFCVQSIGLE